MLNLITVVGNNTTMLPHMLKYYEEIADKIYVCVYRQNENDGILEEVQQLGIEPYIIVTDEKYNWNKVTEIYNTVRASKPNDWWIISDSDEFHSYSYDLEEIIKDCEKYDYTIVTGGFLDRIGPEGIFAKVDKDTNIFDAFPYAGFFRYPMSGACPNKVTLAKGSQPVTSGQHYAQFDHGRNSWGRYHPKKLPVEHAFTQVHHFKWDSTCIDRIKDVAETKQTYTYWWEYQKLYDAIKNNGSKIDIDNKKFRISKLKNSSYIDYNDYPYWKELTDIIVTI